jgi:hypothetical protein
MACLLYLTFITISLALVTTLIALAVPVWQQSSFEETGKTVTLKTYIYSGLWSVCTRKEIVGSDVIDCNTYLDSGVDCKYIFMIILIELYMRT